MSDTWSAAELGRAAGVTVRTLHHYDEIGLLVPAERTATGHRRYTADDVRRLYRVRALRQLGVPLDRIAAALDTDDLRAVIAAQLAGLDAHARRLDELRRRVRGLLDTDDPRPGRLLDALERMSLLDPYLSPRHRDELAARRDELGERRIDELRAEWTGLVADLHRHHLAGTPVTDPDVRRIVTRWDEIVAAFRTGDQGTDRHVADRLVDLWRDHGDRIAEDLDHRAGWRLHDVLTYLKEARDAR
ncbi:MAG: MerR family transcriptional regulator [Saccharothrix sp.]|nr:MerR family transcriptional regulator [Saccharothrix sp.]